MTNRRQAIIWTKADPVHWHINAALGGNELGKLHVKCRSLASEAGNSGMDTELHPTEYLSMSEIPASSAEYVIASQGILRGAITCPCLRYLLRAKLLTWFYIDDSFPTHHSWNAFPSKTAKTFGSTQFSRLNSRTVVPHAKLWPDLIIIITKRATRILIRYGLLSPRNVYEMEPNSLWAAKNVVVFLWPLLLTRINFNPMNK